MVIPITGRRRAPGTASEQPPLSSPRPTSRYPPRMNLVDDLFATRSGDHTAAVTRWVVDVFEGLFGITPAGGARTELYVRPDDVEARADVVVEDGIGIVTRRHLPDEREHAEERVHAVLRELTDAGHAAPVGIATDGVRWSFHVLVDDAPCEFFAFELDASTTDDQLREWLWDGLTPLRKAADRPDPTADAVAETFRPGGPAFEEIHSRFAAEMRAIVAEDPVELTAEFTPWYEIFSYVYDDFAARCRGLAGAAGRDYGPVVDALADLEPFADTDREALVGAVELYARHTYLAVLAKTLAAIVTLDDGAMTRRQREDPASILTGAAVRDDGVHVCDPDDHFAWLRAGADPGAVLGSVRKPLGRFSGEYTDDVFRQLYEGVVAVETRHELGEFFTPRWVAELLVDESVTDPDASVLDPACGSGTFLVFALRRKLAAAREADGLDPGTVERLLDEVWGIDINPLSVILARTNCYLTLVSTVDPADRPAEIRPRVLTADTFVLPRFEAAGRQPTDGDDATADAGVVPVPATDRISVPVHPDLDVATAREVIDRCDDLADGRYDEVPESARLDGPAGAYQRAMFRTMTDLRGRYGDGLGRFLTRHYGLPPLLRGRFDVVVGNPPWLSYREARPGVRETMTSLADEYGVDPPARAKTSFNLAVAFLLTCLDFLGESGTISFVLPLSTIDGAAHAPFVEFLLDSPAYAIEAVYDLEDVTPDPFPHTLPSALLTVSRTGGDADG